VVRNLRKKLYSRSHNFYSHGVAFGNILVAFTTKKKKNLEKLVNPWAVVVRATKENVLERAYRQDE